METQWRQFDDLLFGLKLEQSYQPKEHLLSVHSGNIPFTHFKY